MTISPNSWDPRRNRGSGDHNRGRHAELAAAGYLPVAAVKTHIGRLLDKPGCRDRAQFVVVAYETGVITPGRH